MTSKVHLTFACGQYDHMDALAKGMAHTSGVDLNYITIDHPRDIFDRMIRGLEFAASEMSASEYICRHADGERDLIAIPIFPSRAFRHNCIVVNTDIIQKPSDLNGKRIGVQLYTMTAAVWIRGLLKDAGIDLSTITWVEGDIEKIGAHGNPKTKPLLRPINRVPNESATKSLSQSLADGEIAATIGANPPSCLGKAPNVRRLFPDIRMAEKEYFQRSGIFPIMHLVVIRRDIVDKFPFIPSSLFHAMNESKEIALQRLKFTATYSYMLPFLASDLTEIEQVFGGDPWPYGIEANRKSLEALVSCLYDQGMISREIALDELFAPIHGQNLRI